MSGGIILDFSQHHNSAGPDSPGPDAAKLLNEVASFIRRFIRLSGAQVDIVTVWTAHTHAMGAARETAYLAIFSPEKRSGKTRLLEVLEILTATPWLTGRVTAACLTRKIDQVKPTLLLDESDAAFNADREYAEALRGVLNTGHREDGHSSCCTGQGANISFKDFKTFSAKAFAGISKNLPETVMDRSIPIQLKRQSPGERVERFRRRDVKPEADDLRVRLSDWLSGNISELREARPALPEELTDRQQDGLEPLLAIAEKAGGGWPERVRNAAIKIFNSKAADDQSIGVQLLQDIRTIFDGLGDDKISSEDLIGKLREIESSPWADWDHGKGLSKGKLARLLSKYEVVSRKIRFSDRTLWGYLREFLEDSWSRYLSPVPSCTISKNGTTEQPASILAEIHFSEAEQKPRVPFSKSASDPHECCIVPDVPFLNEGYKGGQEKTEGITTLPSCPRCCGYALYREKDGRQTCQTCS